MIGTIFSLHSDGLGSVFSSLDSAQIPVKCLYVITTDTEPSHDTDVWLSRDAECCCESHQSVVNIISRTVSDVATCTLACVCKTAAIPQKAQNKARKCSDGFSAVLMAKACH